MYRNQIEQLASGNQDGMRNVSQKNMKLVKFPIPKFEEQKEILQYLDTMCSEIDVLIAKKQEIISELENYKKSLIYEYVTGKKEVQ